MRRMGRSKAPSVAGISAVATVAANAGTAAVTPSFDLLMASPTSDSAPRGSSCGVVPTQSPSKCTTWMRGGESTQATQAQARTAKGTHA